MGYIRYIVGPDTLDPKLNLLHVYVLLRHGTFPPVRNVGSAFCRYGTPYEMGYAYGELMAEEMKVLYPQAYEFMYSELGSVLKVRQTTSLLARAPTPCAHAPHVVSHSPSQHPGSTLSRKLASRSLWI